jgi:S1-C subfamily serine protease
MSASQDQPGQGEMPTLPTPPPPPWFPGDQADPWAGSGRGGWGGPDWSAQPPQPPRPPRKGRGVAVMAAVAAVGLVAGATGFHFAHAGASGAAATSTTALTTSQIATKTDPGLVDIVSTLGDQNAEAAGTGQVVTSSGEVLTNDHVITGATSIKATDVGNGRTYTANVVGYDQTNDVAVIQLQGASGLATVSFGNSSQVASGSQVVALGNAGGKGGTPSVAAGSVTALNQSITASDDNGSSSEQLAGMIETNADIQPGDSGGPLVNASGQVIGMDTAASTGSGNSFGQSPNGQGGQGGPDGQSPWWQFPSGQSPSGQSPSGQSPSEQSPSSSGQSQNQAYAIPINRALSIASEIEAGHASSTVHIGATGFLGVELSSEGSSGSGFGGQGSSGSSGVALQGVLPGSPAAGAGLGQGDVITSIAGQNVSSQSSIESVIQRYHPGDKVSVGWTDGFGQSHTATVTLATGPAD